MRKSVKLVLIAVLVLILASSLFACNREIEPPYKNNSNLPNTDSGTSDNVDPNSIISVVPVALDCRLKSEFATEKIILPMNDDGIESVGKYKCFTYDMIGIKVVGDITLGDGTILRNQSIRFKTSLDAETVYGPKESNKELNLSNIYIPNDQDKLSLKTTGKHIIDVLIPELFVEKEPDNFTSTKGLTGTFEIKFKAPAESSYGTLCFKPNADEYTYDFNIPEGGIKLLKDEIFSFTSFNEIYKVVNKKNTSDTINYVIDYWLVESENEETFKFGNPTQDLKDPIEQSQDPKDPIEQSQDPKDPIEQSQDTEDPIEQSQDPKDPIEQSQDTEDPIEQLFKIDAKKYTLTPIFTNKVSKVYILNEKGQSILKGEDGTQLEYITIKQGDRIDKKYFSNLVVPEGKQLQGWLNDTEVWDMNSPVNVPEITLTPKYDDKTFSLTIYLRGGFFKYENGALPKPQEEGQITVNGYTSFQKYAPYGVNILKLDGFKGGDYYKNYKSSVLVQPNKPDGTEAVAADLYLSEILKSISKPDFYQELKLQVKGLDTETYWNPKDETTGADPNNDPKVIGDLVLTAKWDLITDLDQDQDKINAFNNHVYKDNFTVKADGTIRLEKIEDYYIENLIIPDVYHYNNIQTGKTEDYKVSEIGDMMCQNFTGLTRVNMSKATNLTKIGYRAFANCIELDEIVPPDTSNIETIGAEAFEGTGFIAKGQADGVILGNILLNKNVENDGTLTVSGTNLSIAAGAFADRTDITAIDLKGVKRIESGAFANCTNLGTVTINNAIEYIAPDAFSGTKLTPDSTSILNANSIIFADFYLYRVDVNKGTTEITIPEGITTLGEECFANNPQLKTINFTSEINIDKVYKDAFKGTEFITNETYYSAKTYVQNGFVVINGILCNYTGSESAVEIPKGIKQIAQYAFSDYHNKNVVDIIIPPSVTKIHEYAFKDAFSKPKVRVTAELGTPLSDARILFQDNNANLTYIHPSAFATDYTILENGFITEVKDGLPSFLKFYYPSEVALNNIKNTVISDLKTQFPDRFSYYTLKSASFNERLLPDCILQHDTYLTADQIKQEIIAGIINKKVKDDKDKIVANDVDLTKVKEIFNLLIYNYCDPTIKNAKDEDVDKGVEVLAGLLLDNDYITLEYADKTKTLTYQLYSDINHATSVGKPIIQVLNVKDTIDGVEPSPDYISLKGNSSVELIGGPFTKQPSGDYTIFEGSTLDLSEVKLKFAWKVAPGTKVEIPLKDLGITNRNISFDSKINQTENDEKVATLKIDYVINKDFIYRFSLDYKILKVKYTKFEVNEDGPNVEVIESDPTIKIPINTSIFDINTDNFNLIRNDGKPSDHPSSFNRGNLILKSVTWDDSNGKSPIDYNDPILKDLGSGSITFRYTVKGQSFDDVSFKFKVIMVPNIANFEFGNFKVKEDSDYNNNIYEVAITGINPLARGTLMVPSYVTGKQLGRTLLEIKPSNFPENLDFSEIQFKVVAINNSKVNKGVTEIGMPSSIREIGPKAFKGWINLKRIGYYKNLKDGKFVDELGAEDFDATIPATQTAYNKFPSELERIGSMAFEGTALEEVIIGSESTKFESIGNGAFANSQIVSVVLNVVKQIGTQTFYNCPNLRTVTLPIRNTADPTDKIQIRAFYQCYMLYEIKNLANWTMEDGAITECPLLVPVVGKESKFESCANIEGLNIEGTTLKGFIPGRGEGVEYLVIPSGVTAIEANAFANNLNLKVVVIHDTVENIGEKAFSGCKNLTKVIYIGTKPGTIASTAFEKGVIEETIV